LKDWTERPFKERMKGLSNEEIAARLKINKKTIAKRKDILKKLDFISYT